MDRLEGEYNRTAAEEWFGVSTFESTPGTIHVTWARTALHPVTAELP